MQPPEQLLLSPAPSIPDPASSTPASGPPSLHTLLVFFLSAVQSVSTAALTLVHLYKQTLHTIQQVNQSSRPPSPGPASALGVVPSPLQSDQAAPGSLSLPSSPPPPPPPEHPSVPPLSNPSPTPAFCTSPLSTSHAPLPPLSPSPPPSLSPYSSSAPSPQPSPSPDAPLPSPQQPHDLARAPLALLATLFSLRDRFAGAALLALLSMLAAACGPFLDRCVPAHTAPHRTAPDRAR